jgi:hypothetical protein
MATVPKSPTPPRKQPLTFHERVRQWLESSPPAEQRRPPPVPTPVQLRGPVIHPKGRS